MHNGNNFNHYTNNTPIIEKPEPIIAPEKEIIKPIPNPLRIIKPIVKPGTQPPPKA